MFGKAHIRVTLLFTFILAILAPAVNAQSFVFHQVDGRVQFKGPINNIHVRLFQKGSLVIVEETFSRGEGQFSFTRVPEGEYTVETAATDKFAASATDVSVRPLDSRRPQIFIIYVQLQLKPPPETVKPAVITADVDTRVPKEAQKRYREGMKALAAGSSERAIAELQAALKIHPEYYAARLELGRALRVQNRFQEAAEILKPLSGLAPKRAEPRVEYGIVLLALDRRDEAAVELRAALELEETNWVPHLYLGMALSETDAAAAERHLRRALELSESRAARAHLSLARLAAGRGQRQLAVEHLQAYLTLTPDAPDAASVRQLIERLR